jgi:hypothetical protein
VLARSLAKKPDLRFQDGDEFARELRAAMAALAGQPATTTGAAAAADGAADDNRSVAFRAAPPADAVSQASVMASGNAFAPGVPGGPVPGYDAAQKDELAPGAQFDETIVMNKSGAPERPQAGGGNTGQEP